MYKVIAYGDDSGPYAAFRESVRLSGNKLVTLDTQIENLKKFGLDLLDTKAMDKIEDDIYELRPGSYRVLCFFDQPIDTFLLMNGFRKNTPKTPESEKVIARNLVQRYRQERDST